MGPWVLRRGRELRGPRTLRTCILNGAVVRTFLGHLTQTLQLSAALLAPPSWTTATAPTMTKRLLPPLDLAGSGVLDTAVGSRALGSWMLIRGRELRGPRTVRMCILGGTVRTSLGHLTQPQPLAAIQERPSWGTATAPTTRALGSLVSARG